METQNREEIFEKVREVLIEGLGADKDEVTLEAALTTDLAAESIDLLDIGFRIEQKFGINIPRGEFLPAAEMQEIETVEGVITKVGMEKLKGIMPHLDLTKMGEYPHISTIQDTITVKSIVDYIEERLKE